MRVLTQQPQVPVQINRSQSLARGIKQGLVVTGAGIQSAVDPTQIVSITNSGAEQTVAYSVQGSGLNGSNSSIVTAKLSSYPDPTNVSAATYFIFGYTKNRFVYNSIDGPLLLRHGSNRIRKTDFSDGSGLSYSFTTANFEYPGATASNVVNSYSKFSAAMRFEQGGTQYFYANGKLVASDSTTATTASLSYDLPFFPFEMGSYNGLDSQIALFWDRALSDAEISALHENPWQLFRTSPSMAERAFSKFQILPESGYFDQIDYGRTLTRTNFPRQQTQIDRSNSLARNMTFLWSASSAKRGNIADKNLILNYYPDPFLVEGTNLGMALIGQDYNDYVYFQTTDSATELNSEIRPKNTSWTFGGLFVSPRQPNGAPYFIGFGNANSSTQFEIRFLSDTISSNKLLLRVKENNGAYTTVYSDYEYGLLQALALVVVAENNNIHWYINGVLQSSVVTTIANVGAINDMYTEVDKYSKSYLVFATTDVWTQTQVSLWTQNPWQLFALPNTTNKKILAIQSVLDISRKFLLFFG